MNAIPSEYTVFSIKMGTGTKCYEAIEGTTNKPTTIGYHGSTQPTDQSQNNTNSYHDNSTQEMKTQQTQLHPINKGPSHGNHTIFLPPSLHLPFPPLTIVIHWYQAHC